MTPMQLRAAFAKLGLTQGEAAELLGSNARTVRRWLAGECGIPAAISILLRLTLKRKICIGDIAAQRRKINARVWAHQIHQASGEAHK